MYRNHRKYYIPARYSIALLTLILAVLSSGVGHCEPSSAPSTDKYTEITNIPTDNLGVWFGTDIAKLDNSIKLSVLDDEARKGRVLQLDSARLANSIPCAANFTAILTDFATISLDVWSKNDTAVAVAFQDTDKVSFHSVAILKAGEWQSLKLKPSDFKADDNAPIKKTAVEPLKLRSGMLIADLGTFLGKTGPNSIRIVNLRIESSPLEVVNLPPLLDGKKLVVTSNSILKGNTFIVNGGSLRIQSPRTVVNGNISVNKGTLEFDGSLITMKGRFAHERALIADSGSTISFRNCSFTGSLMSGIILTNNSRLELDTADTPGIGFTVSADSGSTVDMRDTKSFGEFIINHGSHFKGRNSDSFLVWLAPKGPKHIDLQLPDGAKIDKWQMPETSGFDIDIQNCTGVLWGLISPTGSDVKVSNSKLIAAGLFFAAGPAQTITGMKNNQPATKLKVSATDRKLEFENCTIGAWNFYAFDGSNVTLKDCLAGETMSMGTGKMLLENCTVDGSGGYVKSSDKSQLHMVKSKTTCSLVAEGTSTMTLEDCDITGSLSAAGTANVKLNNTKITGSIDKLDSSTITVIK